MEQVLMEQVLFVCMSHTLTADQIAGLQAQFGDIEVVTIASVNPDLAKKVAAIPAAATINNIKDLAWDVVETAKLQGATHFFCTGEPTLMLHANLAAHHGTVGVKMRCVQSTTERTSIETPDPNNPNIVHKTQVFKHVQWRDMF